MEQQPLPPIEQRVTPVLLQALRSNNTTARKLQQEGLYQALKHLHDIEISIPRCPPTELHRMMQRCYPRSSLMTECQYKQRSISKALERMEILEEFQGRSPQVAMYGDSMFERLSWQRLLRADSEQLFNFSKGGDGVEHLKCRMAIAHRTYFAWTSTFIMMIGINNVMGAVSGGNESMSAAASPEEIADAIAKLVQLILRNSLNEAPPTVHLCKLLHVLGSETLNARVINRKVDEVNRLLEKLPESLPGCQLLNTKMPVQRRNYTDDGLHLSRAGYRLLMAQLPEFVSRHTTRKLNR